MNEPSNKDRSTRLVYSEEQHVGVPVIVHEQRDDGVLVVSTAGEDGRRRSFELAPDAPQWDPKRSKIQRDELGRAVAMGKGVAMLLLGAFPWIIMGKNKLVAAGDDATCRVELIPSRMTLEVEDADGRTHTIELLAGKNAPLPQSIQVKEGGFVTLTIRRADYLKWFGEEPPRDAEGDSDVRG